MWLEQGAESGRDWLAARDIRVVRHRESASRMSSDTFAGTLRNFASSPALSTTKVRTPST